MAINRTSTIAALAWRMAALQGEEFHVHSIWSALDGAWQFQYAVAKEHSIFQRGGDI